MLKQWLMVPKRSKCNYVVIRVMKFDEGVSGNNFTLHLNLVDDLIKWVQEVDTTRPVTNGDNRKNTNPNAMLSQINQKIYEAGGVVGMNYANGDQTIAMHNTYSDWPLYGSETASAVHSREFIILRVKMIILYKCQNMIMMRQSWLGTFSK